MTYTAEISRQNPACFIFLIDQSGSMNDLFGGGESNQHKLQKGIQLQKKQTVL